MTWFERFLAFVFGKDSLYGRQLCADKLLGYDTKGALDLINKLSVEMKQC